jgi:hypothetical protein
MATNPTIGAAGSLGVFGGDGNRFLAPSVLASEALMRLNDVLFLGRLINRNYQDNFEGKIGDTIRYKKPYYPVVIKGRVLDLSTDFNNLYDEYGELKITQWNSVPFKFNSNDLTHVISSLGERYLQPGVEELGHIFDEDCGEVLGNSMFRMLGTPGTSLSLENIQRVPGYATEVSIPNGKRRFCIIEPDDMVQIRIALKSLTSQDRLVWQALKDAYIGSLSRFQIFESTNVGRMKCHDYGSGTPLVNMADGFEGLSLPTDGWETTAQKILNKGQLIQIAGCYETGMRGTRRSTGRLMTLVVTADVSSNASGQATIPIYPELNAGTLMGTDGANAAVSKKGFQNVSAKAANNAAITVVGTKGHTYRQALFGTRDVATMATVRIIPPPSMVAEGNAYAAEDTQTGLSILIARDHEFKSLTEWHRMDAKYGLDACYPEQGVRIPTSRVLGD